VIKEKEEEVEGKERKTKGRKRRKKINDGECILLL